MVLPYITLADLDEESGKWSGATLGNDRRFGNNRKAKFYSVTKAGKRQMKEGRTQWKRLATVMGSVLAKRRRQGYYKDLTVWCSKTPLGFETPAGGCWRGSQRRRRPSPRRSLR